MHGRIVSGADSAFPTHSGSAIRARATAAASAWPAARIASAVAGVLMRPTAMTGTSTAARIPAASDA